MQLFHRKTQPKSREAENARYAAEISLHTIQGREAEVHAVAEASKKFRRENHFANALQDLFEIGGPPHDARP